MGITSCLMKTSMRPWSHTLACSNSVLSLFIIIIFLILSWVLIIAQHHKITFVFLSEYLY